MFIIKTFGFKVFSDTLEKIKLDSKSILNTISPNSYGISTYDSTFNLALKNSDILVLDGVYFALGYFLSTGKRIKANQGPFVTKYFLEKANRENLKVFFMGSSDSTLEKIKNNINSNFPSIRLGVYSPPFKAEFNEEDSYIMIDKINQFKPDILFVGMTCPKQEKWTYKYRDSIDAKLICNVGAVFDWIAGTEKAIHPLWWKFRLAWLKRTIDRPEILKRYPNIGIYFKDLILALFGLNNIKLK